MIFDWSQDSSSLAYDEKEAIHLMILPLCIINYLFLSFLEGISIKFLEFYCFRLNLLYSLPCLALHTKLFFE